MGDMILVVADEALTGRLLNTMLTEAGYRVVLAPDPARGAELVQRCHPNLVLLDLDVPGGDALRLCQQLKADETTARLPVVVVMEPGRVGSTELALTHGADDFLTKPLRAEDVCARVQGLLHVRTIRHDLHRALAYLRSLELGLHARWADALAAPEPPRVAGKVLLLDDDALSRELHEGLLREQGLEVVVAAAGAEAIALAGRELVDVAVLDIVMPGLSGLEVLERLRRHDPTLPIIMLTAHVTSQHAIAALKLGAFDFIVKGRDVSLLVLAVDRALRHRGERLARQREIDQLRQRVRELERELERQRDAPRSGEGVGRG